MTQKILFICPGCGDDSWVYDDGEQFECPGCGKTFRFENILTEVLV